VGSALASTYTGQHNTEKCGHISRPRAVFEPTIPVFERPKKVRVLDFEAIGSGIQFLFPTLLCVMNSDNQQITVNQKVSKFSL
jgi:hypothetical protein